MNMSTLNAVTTDETTPAQTPVVSGFATMPLPDALHTSLARMNFTTPTPIQAKAIPVALTGRDIMGSAQTGTGKTAAFIIPALARLINDPASAVLVMSPTRELATQILAVVHQFLFQSGTGIRTALLIGGESMGKQFAQLNNKPRIIIGTPGRLNDHLRRNPGMLRMTNFVVLDEADRMLDMGFSVQIDEVLENVTPKRQMLMFSATFPESIVRFSRTYLNNPERISVDPAQISAVNIKHEVVQTSEGAKYDDLVHQLKKREGSIIIFVKTKRGADRLGKRLVQEQHSAGIIHGGLTQGQRDRSIKGFRDKKVRIMVATDVAARGLDVPHIEHVINFDLPQVAEDYIHRIGRTARAGATGTAISLICGYDRGKWNEINALLNPGESRQRHNQGRPDRGHGGNGGGGGRGGRPNNFSRDGGRGGNGGGFSRGPRPERKQEGGFSARPGNGDRDRNGNGENRGNGHNYAKRRDGTTWQPRAAKPRTEQRDDFWGDRPERQAHDRPRPAQPAQRPRHENGNGGNFRKEGAQRADNGFRRDSAPGGQRPDNGFRKDAGQRDGQRPPEGGFKKRKPGSKPKSFKFKEHSRKENRGNSESGNRAF